MEDRIEAVSTDLIHVVQLPIIEQRLRELKDKVNRRTAEALALVCTEDKVQAVKAERAKLNQEFSILEDQRKAVKAAILKPYDEFEAVYKECVSDAFKAADAALKGKIDSVESELKRRCEEGLRAYFDELCAVHHLDWLSYERAGVTVDMASAKAKTPSKLRRQLSEFVARINDSVNAIADMENADEIMVEFQRTLDAAGAICTVSERHRRIEAQKAAQEARRAEQEREDEMVRRVEALAPPVVKEETPEQIFKCTFTVRATKPQLRKLKEFLKMEGIQYE